MVYWALAFLTIAVIAALLGFGVISIGAAAMAQSVFLVFLVLFAGALLAALVRRGGGTPTIYP